MGDFLHRGEPVEMLTVSCYRRVKSMAADKDGRAAIITWAACHALVPNLILVDFDTGFCVDLKHAPSLLGRCVSECSKGSKVVAVTEGLYEAAEKDFMKEFSAAAAARAVSGGSLRFRIAHIRRRLPFAEFMKFSFRRERA
jgi:hypothetical protein